MNTVNQTLAQSVLIPLGATVTALAKDAGYTKKSQALKQQHQ